MAEATRSWKEKLDETEARKREEMEELKVRQTTSNFVRINCSSE